MGSRTELAGLLSFCEAAGIRPLIDEVMPLSDARRGFERLATGDVFGKLVLTV